MYTQTSGRHKKKKRKKRLTLLLAGIFLVAAVLLVLFFLLRSGTASANLQQLPFSSDSLYTSFDNGIVSIQGKSLTATDENLEPLFETTLSLSDTKVSVENDIICVYTDDELQALNLKGEVLLSVQPQAISAVHSSPDSIAVLCDLPDGSQVVRLYDLGGNELATIEANYTILSFGFNSDGNLWTLALDTSGVVLASRITTYKDQGNSINGIISLESQIIQDVLFSKQQIYAAGTNHIIGSNYIGETQDSILVYGWNLMGSRINAQDEAVFLLTPRMEDVGTPIYNAARIIHMNGGDHTTQLPPDCTYVLLGEDRFYALAGNILYVYSLDCELLRKTQIPFEAEVLQPACGNRAFLTSGQEVYLLELP
ncbi:MAG: DUF5711 family protein [Christensenellales bacterium]|jgi:hypothetical protein